MLQNMYSFTLKMHLLIYYISRIWLYILRKMVIIIKECHILKINITFKCYCIQKCTKLVINFTPLISCTCLPGKIFIYIYL